MELIKKSDDNFQSAKYLYDNSLYASSVHCCYYSCLQTAITQYVSISKKKYSDIQNEIANDNKKHVHSFYIDKLKGIYLSTSTDVNKGRISRNMHNLYKGLKELRVDADYNDKEIDDTLAKKAIENCEIINGLLKSIK